MLRTWFLAGRPWSLTATIVPVTLGASIAVNQGLFNGWLFMLSLIGGGAIQLGTNYTNTYGDYLAGVDTIKTNYTQPQLVQGELEASSMLRVGQAAFALAFLIGLYLTYLRGWPLFVIGALGILGGYGYTLGVAYKYKGLGTILVFFLMGPMMAWAAYYVQTGQHSWLPILAALPIGFLIAGLLHANDFRDLDHDAEIGITTLGTLLGFDKSLPFYYLLTVGAYFSLIILVAFRIFPVAALLPLFSLPGFWRQIKDAKAGWLGDREKLIWLEKCHAKLHLQFGLLLIAGILLNVVF